MDTFRKDQIRIAEYSGRKALMKKLATSIDIALGMTNAEAPGRNQKFSNVRLTWNQGHPGWKVEVENVAPCQVNQYGQRLRDDVSTQTITLGDAIT